MNKNNEYPIGSHFKKENIYLGTLKCSTEDVLKMIKEKIGQNMSDIFLMDLINLGVITTEQCDIFYKDEKGYTRFFKDRHIETIKGDNSDGKGTIENIISIWDYYLEEEVIEIITGDNSFAIVVLNCEPMEDYNYDYNLNKEDNDILELKK